MVSAEEGIIDTYYVSCHHRRETFAAKHLVLYVDIFCYIQMANLPQVHNLQNTHRNMN